MKDASYNISFQDVSGLERSYSSRSIHRGLFGFGWCSSLEKSLVILSTKQIVFKDCDREFIFDHVHEDSHFRTRTYQSPSAREEIRFSQGLYVYKKKSVQLTFNRKGLLIEVQTDTETSRFKYDKNILTEVRSAQRHLKLHHNPFGQTTRLELVSTDSPKKTVSYKYQGQHLIGTEQATQKYSFEYNELSNLEMIRFPDQTVERIAYNNDLDQVVKIDLPDTCTQYFEFKSAPISLHQISNFIRKCPGQPEAKKTFEFVSETLADGTTILSQYKIRTQSKLENSSLEIFYDANGATQIIQNGKSIF